IKQMAGCAGGDPKASGDGNRSSFSKDGLGLKPLADSFTQTQGTHGVRGRNDDEKFLTSIAADSVVRANKIGHATGHFLQHGIASEMAMGVIYVFEMIDVGQDNRKSVAAAILPGTLTADAVHDHAAITNAGQIVVRGAKEQLFSRGNELVLQVA